MGKLRDSLPVKFSRRDGVPVRYRFSEAGTIVIESQKHNGKLNILAVEAFVTTASAP